MDKKHLSQLRERVLQEFERRHSKLESLRQQLQQKRTEVEQMVQELEAAEAEFLKTYGLETTVTPRMMTPLTPVTEASLISAPAEKPARKRGRYKKRSQPVGDMTYTKLKPHVLEAVKAMGHRRFTVLEINEYLRQQGIRFKHNWVSVILLQRVKGIERVGEKTHPDRPRVQLIVYQVKSEPHLS